MQGKIAKGCVRNDADVKGGATPLVWRSACDHCDKKWEGRSGDTRERDRMERSDRWWQQ
jgi:hypothetical protein